MSEVIHRRRDDYLMAARSFLDVYCALTVPDNVPFNPKDYEAEAQQFLDDNLCPPGDAIIRVIEKQYEKMLLSLVDNGQVVKNRNDRSQE